MANFKNNRHLVQNRAARASGRGKKHNSFVGKLCSLLVCFLMLFMGAPVNTYADYNYDAYIETYKGFRIRGLTMGVNDTFTLSVGGNDGGVGHGFSTSDSKVVAVDEYGHLTAKEVGEATIYLRLSTDWNKVLDSIKVTVLKTGSAGLATGTELTINDGIENSTMCSFSMLPGDIVVLTAHANDDEETLSNVTWSSSDETVATVESGEVTAKGVGTTTITATAMLKLPQVDDAGNEVVSEEDGSTIYYDKECTASLVVTVLPTPEAPKEEEQPTETTEQKRNPKTGDMAGNAALVGLGPMLLMALGVMLRIGKNKKQKEIQ